MSRKNKILIIIHLCFAFSFLFWLIVQPYVKEVVTRKSELALFEMVMEREALFQTLPAEDQAYLLKGYEAAQHRSNPSFLHEIGLLIFVQTPAFALAWLFFSIAICLLLLFRIEGAAQAAWILPLIVLGYAYFLYSKPQPPASSSLFPSEEYVLAHYVDNPESGLFDKREKLLQGWHNFLIAEWAREEPSPEESIRDTQLERGLFAFNVGRLKWLLAGNGDEVVTAGFTAPPSVFRVTCYLLWNFIFAWFINRQSKSTVQLSPSSSASH